ncbi:MAG: peptidoglycan DD-metalloendopeptidase family protein [Oscillospiraceae bacterium]
MKEKKSFGNQLEAFFEGKGFYIVLFLCAAVIGVSAWVLIMGTNVDDSIGDIGSAGVVVTTPGPVATATPQVTTPEPSSVATPSPTPVTLPESNNTVQVWNENSGSTSTLFVRPVNGETITPYSVDALIYDQTMEDWRAHSGIDIAAPLGTHVLAVSAGEVTSVESDPMYGTTVVISHANGVESIYANLAAQPTVYVGDKVSAGDVIGAIGDTAICESAIETHLHFAMRANGSSVDPENYLP